MKEREIPTKDLKNGAKVVGSIASGTFEAMKPYLKRTFERQVFQLRRKISR